MMTCGVCNHIALRPYWCSKRETFYCLECTKSIIKASGDRPDLLNADFVFIEPELVQCIFFTCSRWRLEESPPDIADYYFYDV